MKSHPINLDEDVFAELQRRATPLVDDVNSVLRRILGLPILTDEGALALGTDKVEGASLPSKHEVPSHAKELRRDTKSTGVRLVPESVVAHVPRGSRLPQADYELPILEALIELGGSAPSSRVIELAGTKLGRKLTPVDFTRVKSGETRWENRARFARLMLKKLGQVDADSPHGTWEITDAGRARVASQRRQRSKS